MANYKDIISGTISNIVGKVKDVAESGTVRDIYDKGVDKAKSCGRIAKLSLEINGETEELKRVYTEIGRLYYEDHKDDAPEAYYSSLFSRADEIREKLSDMEAEIKSMKAEYEAESDDSDIDADICNFEDIVDSCEAEATEDDKPEE